VLLSVKFVFRIKEVIVHGVVDDESTGKAFEVPLKLKLPGIRSRKLVTRFIALLLLGLDESDKVILSRIRAKIINRGA